MRAATASLLASRWAALFGRGAFFGASLIVLALVGDSALARGPSAPTIDEAPTVTPAAAGSLARSTNAPSAGGARDAGPRPAAALASAPEALGDAPPREGSAHGRATVEDPVILNSASYDDLQRLPGVGPKRARAILDARERMTRFRRVEDLLRVKGIGRATLKKLRPLVRIDPPP